MLDRLEEGAEMSARATTALMAQTAHMGKEERNQPQKGDRQQKAQQTSSVSSKAAVPTVFCLTGEPEG